MTKIDKNVKINSYDGIFSESINITKPKNLSGLIDIIEFAKKKNIKICFRGFGKSYGDQSFIGQNNINVDTTRINQILNFDVKKKEVEVESGISIAELLKFLNSKGFMLKCVPGIKEITLGGAVANNVHGKDSFINGFFSDQVKELKYYSYETKQLITKTKSDADFNLFFGSQGLFGYIYSLKIKIYQIKNCIKVKKIFFDNLDDLEEKKVLMKNYEYSYIFLNNFSRGLNFGSGYIELGSPINFEIKNKIDIFKNIKVFILNVSFKIISFLSLQRKAMFLINHIYLIYSKLCAKEKIVTFDDFNFPHTKIPNFYKYLYPKGFFEIQFFVKENLLKKSLREILIFKQKNKIESYISGIKIHGKNNSIINKCDNFFSVGFDFDSRVFTKDRFKYLYEILSKYECFIYFAKDSIFKKNQLSNSQRESFNKYLKIKKQFDKSDLYLSNQIQRIENEKN